MPEPSRLLSLFLAGTGGLVLWSAFPGAGVWPAAFVAVALLYWALGRDHSWWNALMGFVFGLAFFLPHLWWAQESTDMVLWVVLSVLEALFLGLFGVLWTWVRRARFLRGDDWRRAVAFAIVFVAVEQWRAEIPYGGFPWGRLAWSMAGAPMGRAAWLGGSVMVSVLVAFIGVMFVVAVRCVVMVCHRHRRGETRRVVVVGAVRAGGVVMVAASVVWGPVVLPLAESTSAGEAATSRGEVVYDAGRDVAQEGVLRAGAVQGNVRPGWISFANRAEVLNNHLAGTYALAQEYAGDVDVVLWPENGSDLNPQTHRDAARGLEEASRAVGAPILVGSLEYPKTGGRYNVLLLWQAGDGVTQRYAKQHPVPFGEYIPMRSVLRLFSDQVDRVRTDMLAGVNPPVVDVPRRDGTGTVRLGTVICFEVAYDGIVRDAVLQGAQVLVIPTNNASFGFTAESVQQLAMARMQAITTGRAAVQISTVGVSGVITPDGTVVRRTTLFTPDQFVTDLPLRSSITPAVAAGYWPARIVTGGAIILMISGVAGWMIARRRARQ